MKKNRFLNLKNSKTVSFAMFIVLLKQKQTQIGRGKQGQRKGMGKNIRSQYHQQIQHTHTFIAYFPNINIT